MITNTPYLIKCGVSPEDYDLFDITWVTRDKLILIAVGGRNNKVLVDEVLLDDTRQFELYRSIRGNTVGVIRYSTGYVAVYCEADTQEQLKRFFGNCQQAREIYGHLGWYGNPLRKALHIPTVAIPESHHTYQYNPCEGIASYWKL